MRGLRSPRSGGRNSISKRLRSGGSPQKKRTPKKAVGKPVRSPRTPPKVRKGRSEKVKLKGRRKTLSGDHLQQCILYPAVMASNAKNGSWLCPKCILCAACNLMIDDPSNVECTTCLRAWHGACMPAHGKVVDRRWYCKQCANAPGLSGSPRKIRSQKRASSPVETPSSEIADDVQATPRKRGRKEKGGPSTSFSPLDTVSSSKDDGSLAILKARDELNNAIIAADQSQRESSRSPRKKTYEKAIPHFLEEDAELFEKALSAEESLASVKEESEKQVNEQWVNLGGETDMKEKNPSKNYNLSCLLTLPSEQRNGYGQLLIDMSYQLSRMERKVGGPERPLSDRGLLTYRKYWRSSILCYLRSLKDAHSISLKNMSLATRIHPTDIVNQLLHDNLLVMKDENYYFRTWKRAYKLPLSMLRRRVVDPARINWTPKFDVTVLDPFNEWEQGKMRGKRMPQNIRLSEAEMKAEHFDAARSFIAVEEETQRWSKWVACKNITASGHIATVDALRLFAHRPSNGRFCLSGGRDRAIKLWSLSDLQPLESTKLGSAGMCLGNTPNGLAACSTFGKKVFVIDTRNGLAPVLNYAHHKGAVLTLAMKDNIVYSCGEDRRIVMVDIRNSSKPALGVWTNDYVRSVCFRNNQLICGTNLGMIAVLDPDNLTVSSRLQ
ncbi:WD domain, G-beta repeat protein, partial [Ancylostoma ceylanicum]